LTDNEGKSWISKRWLHKDQRYAYASRYEPMFPFQIHAKSFGFIMKADDGTIMTWIQYLQWIPDLRKFTDKVKSIGFINKHSRQNMKIFKTKSLKKNLLRQLNK